MSVNNYVRAHLDGLGNRFAKIEFVKKDGTIRELTVQRACEKYHIKGTRPEATIARAVNHPELVNVYSVHDKAFRSVNVNAVLAITSDKQRIEYRAFGSTPATGLGKEA